MKTRAAVLHAPDAAYTVEEVDLEKPRPDEVLVRILGTGMCHTDHVARRTKPEMLPAVLGHEGAGIVEQVGSGVTRLQPGDHVVLSFETCGRCRPCLTGDFPYCIQFHPLNLYGTRADGSHGATTSLGDPLSARWFGQSSFAQHVLATERNAVKVDPSVPIELLGPLGCGIQTGAGSIMLGLGVEKGSSVAVFGAGSVGLAAVMAAALVGATTIIAIDLHPGRRALALELGATHVIDGADPELAAAVADVAGDGLDYTLDTSGVPSVILHAIKALGPRGSCGLVGVSATNLDLPPTLLVGRALTFLREGNADPHTFIPELIEHWKGGRFPYDRLVRQYPLDEINEAEKHCHSGETIKPVLVP